MAVRYLVLQDTMKIRSAKPILIATQYPDYRQLPLVIEITDII
jgi:hypothetical protein